MNPQNDQGKHATSSVSLVVPSDQQKNDFARSEPSRKSDRKRERLKSLSISDPPPYLQIQSVPVAERVDPERNSYILVLQPVGIRAAAGQYAPAEADEIARATRGWDWSLDENQRPVSLPALERLLDGICKRSAKGGEA